MVERVRDPCTFRATYGVRTLSPLEKMYDLRASNNPSNWLGPVWGMSNYMVFRIRWLVARVLQPRYR